MLARCERARVCPIIAMPTQPRTRGFNFLAFCCIFFFVLSAVVLVDGFGAFALVCRRPSFARFVFDLFFLFVFRLVVCRERGREQLGR